ncbi:dephospho-CoA kinase [Maribellus sediminis]|uniref:dephospho-CoA kinase n=1 Tax=Maribellus sediminis TaxID=2696285 RepID=UPI001431DE75|nr:dephospho-CoA kinase [Maribellus sediminis]
MAVTVGITGGIGSGKSTVCKVFRFLGVPVFEADTVAKHLTNTKPVIRKGLIELFGSDIYTENGTLDRKKLAGYIFNNDIQLQKVNELIHPVVRAEFLAWAKEQTAPYVIHEAAILFESGFYKMMDYTLLVSAPEKERIARVMKRDKVTEQQVIERIKKQWPDSEKRKLATAEIKNSDSDLILPGIIKIDKQLRENGKIW